MSRKRSLVTVDWRGIRHDRCDLPTIIPDARSVRLDWECPVCGQRWYSNTHYTGWHSTGEPARRWRKREQKRLERELNRAVDDA